MAVVAMGLISGGCAEIEVSDCAGIDSRSDCEDADVEFGECRWVDVYTPFVDAGSCDLGEPEGMCVGLSGTEQGCSGFECPNGNGGNFYTRMVGELPEVFVNPECGPQPYGDWEACTEGPSCACLCDVDAG